MIAPIEKFCLFSFTGEVDEDIGLLYDFLLCVFPCQVDLASTFSLNNCVAVVKCTVVCNKCVVNSL